MPIKMARGRPSIRHSSQEENYLDKLSGEVQSNQSRLSMVLGALIILVIGILIFNYFKGSKESLGPAQQTAQQEDVSPENLPGKYIVKEGDTLFTIAEKYYKDGYKFSEIAKANNLANVDSIEKGQVLQIPKLTEVAMASPLTAASQSPQASPSEAPKAELGTGGGNTTIWGSRIEGNSYTVVEGDWLSTIAGRAYGDIYAYKKLAEVNNIPNPDLIFPGQEIKIPR